MWSEYNGINAYMQWTKCTELKDRLHRIERISRVEGMTTNKWGIR